MTDFNDELLRALNELGAPAEPDTPDEEYTEALRQAETFAFGEGSDLFPLELLRVLLARWPLRHDDADPLARV
jgi:hypothetical protein